jgi:hypothetical protein
MPGQTVPHAPQFDTVSSCVQLPAQQPLPIAQVFPQAPQSVAVFSFLQLPAQQSSSLPQALPQRAQFCLVPIASDASASVQPGGSMSPQRLN